MRLSKWAITTGRKYVLKATVVIVKGACLQKDMHLLFLGSVFIGSNIPHLNFDYGVKTDYQKTVLHVQQDFLSEAFLKTPELVSIHQLFEKAAYGVVFSGETKAQVLSDPSRFFMSQDWHPG